MKSSLTDQDLIDVTIGFTPWAGHPIAPSNFTKDMLAAMRAIADAAVARAMAEGMVPHTRLARPNYETMLRDEFAGRALPYAIDQCEPHYRTAAEIAYKIADAMMEARNANR